jgi:hypothetical protein
MLLYEMLIAIGIALVLVVAAIDRLAARVMIGPEEMASLRLARAAEAQRRLVASAAQQEREARAAAAQRRLVVVEGTAHLVYSKCSKPAVAPRASFGP